MTVNDSAYRQDERSSPTVLFPFTSAAIDSGRMRWRNGFPVESLSCQFALQRETDLSSWVAVDPRHPVVEVERLPQSGGGLL